MPSEEGRKSGKWDVLEVEEVVPGLYQMLPSH